MADAVEHLPHDDPAALLRWADAADDDLARLAACAPHLSVLFRLSAPHAPGAVVVGAVAPQPGGPPLSATGAGFTRRAALAACLGEATEIFAQRPCPGDVVANAPLVDPPAGHGLAEGELRAAAARGLDPAAPLPWVCAQRLPDGEACLLPAALVLRGVGAAPDAPLSIGCAAGATLADATDAALREVFERHAVARWRRGGPAWATGSLRRAVVFAQWLARVDDGFGPPVVVARSLIAEGAGAGATVAHAAGAALRELIAAQSGAMLSAIRGDAPAPLAPPSTPRRGAPRPGQTRVALAQLAAAGTPARRVALLRPELAPVAKVICFGLATS